MYFLHFVMQHINLFLKFVQRRQLVEKYASNIAESVLYAYVVLTTLDTSLKITTQIHS